MSYVRLSGRFADLPATVVVDTSVAESSVSMTYANNNNVPRDVTSISSVAYFSCSGPVIVPAGPGWFHSRMPFKMAYHNHCDVLLGVDWITACQPMFAHGGILPPSDIVVSMLPIGHSWICTSTEAVSKRGACLCASLPFLVLIVVSYLGFQI